MNVGGLNDNIKAMANELASEDYVVLAADLFHVKIATDPSRVRELTSTVTDNPEFLPLSASKIYRTSTRHRLTCDEFYSEKRLKEIFVLL